MPQLDLSAFFLQFLTISSLLFWLTWLLINNILEIVYMIIICRNTIITYFNNLKLKYNYLINKLFYFKLNIFTFFQVELKNILINFYKLIKFNIFKLINFLPKILTIYNYFSRLQVFISAVQLKLNDNLIINHSLLNLKQLNV
jgi:hypothetical protein